MDQIQDHFDPEVAKDVIALLNRKIVNLRSENAELQGQLRKSSPDGTLNQVTPVSWNRSELERRPSLREVAALEEELKESKQRGQELGNQVDLLNAKLEESESELQNASAFQEQLEKVCLTFIGPSQSSPRCHVENRGALPYTQRKNGRERRRASRALDEYV
ncbi:hypothetical protein BJ322DRAFT_501034 [Thelephora terrestris]|uniref:Uncharacterized protein n=1 Tax=Thelephora terrestris TaxID=56493 RepID=A0A9P6L194_9AGAM|nr:hypothetical protein BJ322DRAFT_501034 [Thelephora terrestris]